VLPSRIPVVKVGKGGVVGTPEDFETQYERRRKKASGQVQRQAPQPKLKEISNPSMQDRLADFGIGEL